MDIATAKRLRVGSKVRFNPNPVSLGLYSNPPVIGDVGKVTSVPFGGGVRKSYLPGPGGGLLYVAWEKSGTQGVSAIDAEKVS